MNGVEASEWKGEKREEEEEEQEEERKAASSPSETTTENSPPMSYVLPPRLFRHFNIRIFAVLSSTNSLGWSLAAPERSPYVWPMAAGLIGGIISAAVLILF